MSLPALALAPIGSLAGGDPPLPSAEQLAWHDLELGMFVHLAPQTWQDSDSDDLSTALSAIDHAKIDRFTSRSLTEVRWRCLESVGEPAIRRFAVYGGTTVELE